MSSSTASAPPFNEGDGSLNPLFQAIPISTFPPPALGKLVTIPSDASIVDAVRVLSENNILAAPVVDVTAPADASFSDKYAGIVDMGTLVIEMLETLRPEEPHSFLDEAQSRAEFRSAKVGDKTLAQFIPVQETRDSLLDCMLLCGLHTIRRVPVISDKGALVNIITQSALVQTLSANLDRLDDVGSKTLAEAGLSAPRKVWSVTDSEPLHAAFSLMKKYDISAVPVVSTKTGKIRGNISARDARLLAKSDKIFKLLNMPISAFLEVVTETTANSAFTCIASDNIRDVILTLVRARIHRLYLVDTSGTLVRVISLSDVLQLFVKEPEGHFGHYFK